MLPCPECGRPSAAEAAACAICGHVLANGTAAQVKSPAEKPPPPPEVSGWIIHKTPPEMIEEFLRTFKEEEFLAELREVEQNGGAELKDFIQGLEKEVAPRE